MTATTAEIRLPGRENSSAPFFFLLKNAFDYFVWVRFDNNARKAVLPLSRELSALTQQTLDSTGFFDPHSNKSPQLNTVCAPDEFALAAPVIILCTNKLAASLIVAG